MRNVINCKYQYRIYKVLGNKAYNIYFDCDHIYTYRQASENQYRICGISGGRYILNPRCYIETICNVIPVYNAEQVINKLGTPVSIL